MPRRGINSRRNGHRPPNGHLQSPPRSPTFKAARAPPHRNWFSNGAFIRICTPGTYIIGVVAEGGGGRRSKTLKYASSRVQLHLKRLLLSFASFGSKRTSGTLLTPCQGRERRSVKRGKKKRARRVSRGIRSFSVP